MRELSAAAASDTGQLDIRQFDLRVAVPAEVAAWLAQHQPHPIFSSPEWFVELTRFEGEVQHAQHRRTSFWLVIYRDGLPLVAAPVEHSRSRVGAVQLSLLTNFYAPAIDLLVDTRRITRAQAWDCLLRAFDQLYPGWVSFRATPLHDAQRQLLAQACRDSHTAFSYEVSANYSTEIGSLAQYWADRPSRLRSTLRRKGKQLGQIDHRFELAHTPCAEQIAHYWEIYQHSWKHQEPSRSFISWLLAWSAERGYLRLGLLHVEQTVVACQLWLVMGRTAYIFKLAQDLSANRFSPGSLLSEYMINSLVAQDGIDRIDFLLGDDEFKGMWMDRKEPVFWVEVVNRKSVVGLALSAYYQVRNRFRPMPRSAGPIVKL